MPSNRAALVAALWVAAVAWTAATDGGARWQTAGCGTATCPMTVTVDTYASPTPISPVEGVPSTVRFTRVTAPTRDLLAQTEQTDGGARCAYRVGTNIDSVSDTVLLPRSTTAPCGLGPRVTAPTSDLLAAERARLRRAKLMRLVEQLYPASGFLPYVDFFCSEHERLGMPEAWWWSAVYGAANFSLRVGATGPGNCAGPMDVKHWPLVTAPKANIRWHCAQMAGFYRSGVRGLSLCEHVFYPARPHDWQRDRYGHGRCWRTDRAHRACIARGYQVGKLP